MNISPYTPTDWYWIVAGSTTQVYSSSLANYVAVSNATYVAWLATGKLPTKITSEIELGEVLAGHNLRPIAAGVLDAFKDAQASNVTTLVAFKIMFNHENRLRAIERALTLNGSPADLTAGQAKAAVKSLL
jgi:hypothetical protein